MSGSGSSSHEVAEVLAHEMVLGASAEEALRTPARIASAPLRLVDDAWTACTDTHLLRITGQRSTIDAVLKRRKRP